MTPTPEQLQALRAALMAGRIPANDPSLEYAYRRGWNDAIEFAENQVNKIFGKETA
jgi:hypothetical protein